ncbi:unnamed protein product [Prunus armeniaca]|uniref:Uncharacterized protein n=1 Tax=Prunus armeniaca TaxID=36596 RepID=A0A6J5XR48_PRUAR|nr:unnamed protein product [Prunus armeniaca]
MARVPTFPTLESPPRVWFPSVASAHGSLLCDCGVIMVLLFQLSSLHRIAIGMWPLTILSTCLGVAWFLHQENMLGWLYGKCSRS